MHTSRSIATLVALACAAGASAQSLPMTYQGQLKDGGQPANGVYDFEVRAWDALTGGTFYGITCAQDVQVTNGLFTIPLDGLSAIFALYANFPVYLEIAVRPDSPDPCLSFGYTTLAPRQIVSVAPWAAYAFNGAWPWQVSGFNTFYSVGNVGIGTVNPQNQLHVQAAGLSRIRVEAATGQAGISFLSDGTGEAVVYSDTGSDDLRFYVGGQNRMHIGANGNVGIGTTTPAAKLEVAGMIESGTGGFKFPDGTVQTTAATGGGSSQWQNNGTSVYYNGGNVGIGTSTPSEPLEIVGNATGVRVGGTNPSLGLRGEPFGGTGQVNSAEIGLAQNNGAFSASALAGDLVFRVRREAGFEYLPRILFQTGTGSAGMIFSQSGFGTSLTLPGGDFFGATVNVEAATVNQFMRVGNGSANPALDVIGAARVSVLEISGGGDIAEPFNVNVVQSSALPSDEATERRSDEGENSKLEARSSKLEAQPGMVVCIDSANPGELRLSTKAYDRTVAGIISGAGGVKPGMTLRQEGSPGAPWTDGQHPVALTGRVYCWVDADAGGPVQPGDLLTTSDTPGHAMKATDFEKAHGAAIGKAMTELKSGKGLVLVLVSLN